MLKQKPFKCAPLASKDLHRNSSVHSNESSCMSSVSEGQEPLPKVSCAARNSANIARCSTQSHSESEVSSAVRSQKSSRDTAASVTHYLAQRSQLSHSSSKATVLSTYSSGGTSKLFKNCQSSAPVCSPFLNKLPETSKTPVLDYRKLRGTHRASSRNSAANSRGSSVHKHSASKPRAPGESGASTVVYCSPLKKLGSAQKR